MNQVFKVKRNHIGISVATSELAKNNGKVASVLLSTLLGLSAISANATPVSIQGTATSENAVSIGSNSYATAVDGVATGQGSIATGQGFSREDFDRKVIENKKAVDLVNEKQDGVNNINNQIDATNDAIDSTTKQIDDLGKEQDKIKDKIKKRDDLFDQKKPIEDALAPLVDKRNDLQNQLDTISTDGKNLYLNFTDVLNTLNWDVLLRNQSSDANRNTVATELKNKVESNFSDFASKYTLKDYRSIVDGYLNRQASYQGSYEYLANATTDVARYFNDETFFNNLYYNSSLDKTDYQVLEGYKLFEHDIKLHHSSRTNPGKSSSSAVPNAISTSGNLVPSHSVLRILDSSKYYEILKDNESILNSINLVSLSKQKAQANGEYSAIYERAYNANSYHLGVLDNLNLGSEFITSYNNKKAKKHNIYTVPFAIKLKDSSYSYNKFNVLFGYSNIFTDYTGRINGVYTNMNVSPDIHDDNIAILTKIKDFTVSNANLISSDDIEYFKTYYQQLQNLHNAIDWDFDKSAINLTEYRKSLDKIIAYNSKIDSLLNIYQEVIEERKSTNADSSKIDRLTNQIMSLKNDILGGMNDLTNFGAGIELVYNKEWADYYLYYAKDEADAMIKRINAELKLYNPEDQIIVESTGKAKEIQQEYDDIVKQIGDKQKELDDINNKIDELALTDEEKATDDKKREKEQELVDLNNKKDQLEEEKGKAEDELAKAREELAKTDLKDLGLRSQARGSNAFASGNDSIAFGTNSTVTADDGIGIGRDTTVTGKQSIAIGAGSTVTGEKSIAIGVGHRVSGNRSTTIGDPNVVSGNDSFVAGNNNNVASNNVMVLGNNVNVAAGFDGAVVLGNNSAVAKPNPTAKITVQGKDYNFAGINPTSVVSVGAANAERQIVNVAAGRVTATSTDAINGSQLYALAAAIEAVKIDPSQLNEVKEGSNVHITSKTDPTTNKTIYTVAADKAVASEGDGISIVATPSTAADGAITTNYKIGLSDATKKQLAKEEDVKAGSAAVAVKQEGTNSTGGKTYVVDLSAASKAQLAKEEDVKAGSAAVAVKQEGTNSTGGNTYVVDLSAASKAQLAKEEDVKAGSTAVTVVQKGTNKTGGNTFEVDLSDVAKAQLAKETTVSGGSGISVTAETSTNANGGTTTNYVVSLTGDIVKQISKEEDVKAGSSAVTVVQNGTNDTGGKTFVVDLSDASKAQLAKEEDVKAGSTAVTVVQKGTNKTGGNTFEVDLSAASKAQLAKEEDVKAGSTAVTVVQKGTNKTGGNTFEVDLSAATKAQIAKETSVKAGKSKNLVVTQDAPNETGGRTYVVELNNNVDLTPEGSVTVGDVIINGKKITVGGNRINNVGDGKEDSDAVNLKQLKASQTFVKAGTNVKVDETKNANGSTTYTVNAKDTTVSAGSDFVTVKKSENPQYNVTSYTLDFSQDTKDTVSSVKKGWNIATEDGKSTNVQMGDTVKVVGDSKNISTKTTKSGDIQVSLADDVNVNSVKTVKPAEISPTSREVVQGSQLYQTNQQVQQNTQNIQNLNDKVDRNQQENRRGIAASAAMGILPQPHLSGHSMVSAATTHYHGQQALAVGYSRLSDNGKHIIKLSGSSNVSGKKEAMAGASYGYQW